MGEITVILLLALIFLGPSKLPELASGLGRIIREIRKATSDVKNEIALDDTFRKPFEELRDAVTLHPDELKRRDQLRQSLEEARRRAEEMARQAVAAAAEDGASTPPIDSQTGLAAPNAADATMVSPPPVAGEMVSPATPAPVIPEGPPPGTVARREAVALPPPHVPASPVPPPVSHAGSERANATQVLSEADLLPPPPASPPPLPGVNGAPAPQGAPRLPLPQTGSSGSKKA